MILGKITKRNIKSLQDFIQNIYINYDRLYKKYIDDVLDNFNGNRLEQILDFINTWTHDTMNRANDYDIIRNIVTFSNDNISIHKDGKYSIILEVYDSINSVMNMQEFGSIFSIYDGKKIVCAGVFRYSYIKQLVRSCKKN